MPPRSAARYSRRLAAFDAGPDAAEALLRYAVEDWWRAQTVPRLRAGEDPFPDAPPCWR